MLKIVRAQTPWFRTGVSRPVVASSHNGFAAGGGSSSRIRSSPGDGLISRDTTSRRWLSTAPLPSAVARPEQSSPVDAPPVDHSHGERHDDNLLRQIFDSPSAWQEFSARSARFPTENAGLFCNSYLTTPDGFLTYAEFALVRARRIVERVLAASGVDGYRTIVRDLDRLSDLLCRVIDLSDFVRATHPDARIQRAASKAWFMVYQYMNQLNTTTGLNEQLGRAMADPEVAGSWSEEETAVAQLLRLDFIKSAVNLPQAARDRFVDLSQRISELGSDFVAQMAPEKPRVVLPSSKLHGMDPRTARSLASMGNVFLPSMSADAAAALRCVHDEDARREIFLAMRTASRSTVSLLEELLHARAELAELAGFESYGHMSLRDRMMAKSPESVQRFLLALARNNAPAVQEELRRLLQEKKATQQQPTGQGAGAELVLHPWDKDYYMNRIRQRERSRQKHDDSLAAYFSVGSVMRGLSRLFGRLFGIRFVPRETLPGEKWHPDVRRLDVVSDTDGHVAVLYCDLFYRADKSPNPAHFTVRCSREIPDVEIDESALLLRQHQEQQPGSFPSFSSAEAAANDGMAMSRRSGVLRQLPTVALVCDFPQRAGAKGGGPAFLTFPELETLFHEMGHAIHSVLARTSFQNVAGTRCATDLAELPSTLMEHFAADPSVLALFHETGEPPLDYELLAERMRQSQAFEGSDTENQIVLSMLDQAYHSPLVGAGGFDSTAVYHGLQRAHGVLPVDPDSTRWQGFFGHLFGYGSVYYSYLFDQVLAKRCWKVVFDSGRDGAALSRERGERLKESLLRWGGGRDPWRCVSDALGDERIARGDEEAMALVGSWGSTATSTTPPAKG